jgi:hypothetical protein
MSSTMWSESDWPVCEWPPPRVETLSCLCRPHDDRRLAYDNLAKIGRRRFARGIVSEHLSADFRLKFG